MMITDFTGITLSMSLARDSIPKVQIKKKVNKKQTRDLQMLKLEGGRCTLLVGGLWATPVLASPAPLAWKLCNDVHS